MSKIMAQMWSSSKVMIGDLFCTVYVSGLARSAPSLPAGTLPHGSTNGTRLNGNGGEQEE